jgi:hypothetical protein
VRERERERERKRKSGNIKDYIVFSLDILLQETSIYKKAMSSDQETLE